MSEKRDFTDLLNRLGGKERPSRGALRGLSALSRDEASRLRAAWPTLAVDRRRWLVETVVEMAEDNVELDFIELLRIALGDEDAQVRRGALEGLWESEDVAIADALLGMLSTDPDETVRAAAATALGNFTYLAEMEELPEDAANRVRTGLLTLIRDSGAPLEVRRRAVEAVGFLSADEEVHEVIAAAYADPDQSMRMSAVFAMGRNCDPRWLPQVMAELESEQAAMRFEAARAAGEIQDRRVMPRLARLVLDEDLEVKLAAVEALGQIGGQQAIDILRQLRESRDQAIAEAAEEALAEAEFADSPLVMSLEEGLGFNPEELRRLRELEGNGHKHAHDHEHEHGHYHLDDEDESDEGEYPEEEDEEDEP